MKYYFKENNHEIELKSTTLKGSQLEGYCSQPNLAIRNVPLYLNEGNYTQRVKYTLEGINEEELFIKLDITLSGILNKRNAYRICCLVPCIIQVDSHSYKSMMKDLSIIGARLVTSDDITSESLVLHFNISNTQFTLNAKLVQRQLLGNKYEYGIQFEKILLSEEKRLMQLIQSKQVTL